jgi:N-acetylglutamate synthase-like GNAT family acetyltransferase
MHIRPATESDLEVMTAIINHAAMSYRGVIPADCWHEPYMSAAELGREIADGVVFSVAEDEEGITGVMGIQDRGDVALVRHAYVAPGRQRAGIGTALLRHLEATIHRPVLIGTWTDASWAIDFYQRNGFTLLDPAETRQVLRKYWSIPERQVETSVVLRKLPPRG